MKGFYMTLHHHPVLLKLVLVCAWLVGPLLVSLVVLAVYWFDQTLPVVGVFQVQVQKVVEGGVEIEGYMDKVRPCDFIGMSARDLDGDVLAVTPRESSPPTTRPLGPQQFGPWFIPITTTDYVTISAVHTCFPVWRHYETLGSFLVNHPPTP